MVAPSSPRADFLATYRPQVFPFSDSLIYYITKNPSSPKCYEKIIQSCKHFFIKNPILVLRKLFLTHNNNKWEAKLERRDADMNKILSRIWIVNEIEIWNDNLTEAHILSPIIPKIFRCDILGIFFYKQNIYFDDLKFLAAGCEKIEFTNVVVINENGSVIQLEDIIHAFPKCKYFQYGFEYNSNDRASEVVTSKTAAKLIKIQHFSNLLYFSLSGITEAFDIDAFFDNYIKKNKNTKINLGFSNNISERYHSRLQTILDEIVADENRKYKVPLILFLHITESSHVKMLKLLKNR